MEEKINNKRIFRYIPSMIAKMILELDIKDEDVFFNRSKRKFFSNITRANSNVNKLKNIIERQSSIQTNEEIFPMEYPLTHSIIMSVRLKGFEDLILALGFKDNKKKNEKLNCEYIPILFSKILLQISSILSENGGEILKCEDFEFVAVWDFSNFEDIRLLPKYQRFYAKHALISALEIIKKIDGTEIVKKHKLQISIGIEYGESSIYFFGGERRRCDYVIMGESIEGSEHCLHQCNSHEIIIGRELNNIFKRRGEIITTQIGTDDEHKNLYKINIEKSDEYELKNFQDFKNMKLKSNYIVMNHKIYKNLSKKVYLFASVLPQGLVKYLDIGEDENLKELSIITIMTVHILMNLDLIDNSLQIQHLLRDMQKATYLTRGSLLGITKTFNGLMVKCVWGLEPNTFVDEPARAIATSYAMKKLIDEYKIKLSIGIATGACFTGLINIQGNRKAYSILGYKAIISRLLADKANRRNIRNKFNLITDKVLYTDKFIVYCDTCTVKYSQKWYRFNYINDLYMFIETKQEENAEEHLNKVINDLKRKNLSPDQKKKEKKELLKRFKTMSIKTRDFEELLKQKKFEKKNKKHRKTKNNIDKDKIKNSVKIEEIFTPIEYDEYFFQNTLDPFPMIRTYKHNTHNRKNNTFSYNNYLNNYLYGKNENNEKQKEKNNNILSNNKDINEFKNNEFSTRNASKTVFYKTSPRKSMIKNASADKNQRKPLNEFKRINTRFDSVVNKKKKSTRKEENNIYSYINNLNSQRNSDKDYKSMLKLKRSQTIFGAKRNLNFLIKHMTNTYLNNKKQFYLIRGPLGCGKSLLVRKVLNNFIGNDDILGPYYYKTNYQFLFCNLLNPFNEILPFNTISCIFRKIYLLLKLENRINAIFKLINELCLDEQKINDISFILSMEKEDINLLKEFKASKHFKNHKKKINLHRSDAHNLITKKNLSINITEPNISVIKKFEGPFNYENLDEINLFFYEMIKIYFKHLKSKTIINNISLPLIFLIDDIQLSNHHSIEFIKFFYRKTIIEKDNFFCPFIFIMIQQTPFNKNFKKTIPLELEIFLNKYITFNLEQDNKHKIICLEEGPPYEKNILKNIIIFHFKNSVLKNYGTQLTVVDGKILDFLLTKTFNGIPLLAIDLLQSLINSERFIQTFSGEFIITSELNDESDILDWNDILIPYIYEKITSNSLNKILNFREILILKYASIIGTLFDMKMLNKINPLNNIIKDEDIFKLVEKLNENYFIELHNEIQQKKNKLICQITFPFLRETLYQKFLMETRAPFHMKLAVIISMSKRIIYFSLDDEIKFLKRNLFNSEVNIIDEIKRKRRVVETLKDILEIQKDLSYNNLKILLIKEICHNFYKNKLDNLLEGNIEFFSESKSDWIPVFYTINTKNIVFYNQDDEKKEKDERKPILYFGLNSIFKNQITKDYYNEKKRNIIFEISISEDVSIWVPGIHKPRKKINYFFSSERMKDLYQLEIGINFLKMKVNYDKFADNYGHIKFPLYKLKWFVDQEEKYYFDRDNIISSVDNKNKILGEKKQNNYMSVEKLFYKSQKIKKPFELLLKTSLGCFLAIIQRNISNFGKNNNKNNKTNNFLILQMPSHIQKSLNNINFEELSLNKIDHSSSPESLLNNDSFKNTLYSNKSIKRIETDQEKNVENNNINDENVSNDIERKNSKKLNFQLNISFSSDHQSKINNEENLKLSSGTSKNSNLKIFLNNEPTKFDKKNKKYSEFINKTTISFPKKPSSSVIIKKNDTEEEPYFTESNFNTNNNNISNQGGDNSTKLSASTNIKTLSQIGDKNISNNEESALDSLLGINNSLTSKNQNNILKSNNTNLSVEKNNKILFNFEEGQKRKKHSRNIYKDKLMNKSVDNNLYDKYSKDEEFNKKREKLIVKSYDNIYDTKIKFDEDFVPFKMKDKLMCKHVNIISNQDNCKNLPILKVFPSFKFEGINFSQYFNYKNLSNDPKYMYINYYHNNIKVHKSKLFDFNKKKKNNI